jgi:sugar (pentulose or hexulose) kinase
VSVDADTLRAVLDRQIMLLPSVTPDSGPFQNIEAKWLPHGASMSPTERYCAASLYLALMSETCLTLISAEGPTIIDGPFSANPTYRDALAALTGRDVVWSKGNTSGPSVGAALLFQIQAGTPRKPNLEFATPTGLAGGPVAAFERYCARWRAEADARLVASRSSETAEQTSAPQH